MKLAYHELKTRHIHTQNAKYILKTKTFNLLKHQLIFLDMEDQHLQPPALTKQFLISPPASPPLGWEPREEGEPLVNHDLLAAIANLSAGYYYLLLYLVPSYRLYHT